MKNTLITLAEIHYEYGLIGLNEFKERIDIAFWLFDNSDNNISDPRVSNPEFEYREAERSPDTQEEYSARKDGASTNHNKNQGNAIYEFICLKTWVFTKADPDSYPSIPHGHYQHQNNKWPKLNPYTGRVFRDKHLEDSSKRLSKRDLQRIWSDEDFKSFCREMIVWYREQFPYFEFSVKYPLRFPRW